MQQADASPPEAAKQEAVEEQIAPTPPQEKPDVVAPPEQKQATPTKKRIRLILPSGRSQGCASQNIAITSATDRTAPSRVLTSPARAV